MLPARVESLDEPTARWLVGPGQGHVGATVDRLDDGEDELAVGTALRREGLAPAQAATVLGAALARRRLRAEDHPLADDLLVTAVALEQASRPAAARWRAARLRGDAVVDLGVGAGLDAIELATAGSRARPVTGVDLDPARLVLARHNAEVAGIDLTPVCADVLAVDLPHPAHADPGRRDEAGRRLRHLGSVRPPVDALVARWRAQPSAALVVTNSPALDLADPARPADAELAFLQVGEDLVDAVLLLGDAAIDGPTTRAVLLAPTGAVVAAHHDTGESVSPGPLHDRLDRRGADVVGCWLVVPAAALVRARLHEGLGAQVGLDRASTRRGLLLGSARPDGPWWRSWPVVADLPARPRALRDWLRGEGGGRAVEVVLHGHRADLAAWHAGAGRPPRGPNGWRIALVETAAGPRALVLDAGVEGGGPAGRGSGTLPS